MAKVDILFDGYARMTTSNDSKNQSVMVACGSCALVRSEKTTFLFDTLGPWEKDKLLDRLKFFSIHPTDIDYVICSHSHPDHIGNINLFTSPRVKMHIIGTSVYKNDQYELDYFEPLGCFDYDVSTGSNSQTTCTIYKYKHSILTRHVKVIPTPGHTMECISMLVQDSEKGTVGLTGDLFENEEDLNSENVWLSAGSQNPTIQRENRKMIYDSVDYILPGHGPMFKTKRK